MDGHAIGVEPSADAIARFIQRHLGIGMALEEIVGAGEAGDAASQHGDIVRGIDRLAGIATQAFMKGDWAKVR